MVGEMIRTTEGAKLLFTYIIIYLSLRTSTSNIMDDLILILRKIIPNSLSNVETSTKKCKQRAT
jgi:hypothetical protein